MLLCIQIIYDLFPLRSHYIPFFPQMQLSALGDVAVLGVCQAGVVRTQGILPPGTASVLILNKSIKNNSTVASNQMMKQYLLSILSSC